jgi:ABC-type glycerol-3-phosphate transport system substrate-binding protein
MRESRPLWLVVVVALLLAVLVMLLSGCNLSLSPPTPEPGEPTTTPLPSQPTSVPTEEAPAVPEVLTLTVWTTEAFSPTQAVTTGQILSSQVAELEAAYPDVRLEFVLKKPFGKGGILDYLLTTAAVVPDLLPDLVVIDVDGLGAAVQAGIVQPLDDLFPPDLVSDLYPFAREASTFDGRLYALQYQADLDHLVYNTGKMTIAPSSWPGVLSNPGPYLFPAGGQAGLVNDAFLAQYLAVQPWSAEEDAEKPFLEEDSLTAVLQFYQDGVSTGIFPLTIVDYNSTDECWQDYLAGEAALSQVGAHRYMAERNQAQSSAVAPIPAINGAAAGISRGWVLALVASDPLRQAPAIEFMRLWMAAETNAAWNEAATYLPTREASLAYWDEADSYTPLVRQLLQDAQPRPRLRNYAQVAAALQTAIAGVLTGEATPEEAAAAAIESTQ